MIQTTLSLLLLSSVASPQTTPDLPSLESTQALTEWRTDHGARWKTMSTRGTGHPDFLFGGLAQPFNAPVSDAAFTATALDFLARTEGIHGMESETLSLDRALLLPLGQVGSTDKMTVRFHQSVNGVPVKEGAVNVLMNLEGQLLSVQSSGLPLVAGFDTTPSISAAGAMRSAEQTFELEYGLTPTSISRPELSLVQLEEGELIKPALAYEVQAMWQDQGFDPEGQIYWVDAKSGAVINRMPAIHNLDVTGTVYTMATPGTTPDTASNPEIQEPLAYAQVQSSSGTTSTDVNGNFTISGTNGPLNVTIAYVGTFANCNNDTGNDYSLTTSLSGTGNSVVLNTGTQAAVTAEANAYQWVNKMRDWIRAITPGDNTADFLATANCNLNSTCNAYYDGSSINFYSAGGGCVNTAFSSVVGHEEGHWLNVRYGTGNGSDGMGEGNADVFSMYLLDDPIVGDGFFQTGGNIRNGNNNNQFCGDSNPGCYGGVHADGEPWMGAAWKIRTNLKNTNGTANGSLIADTIFLGWMNGYNQSQIRSVIEVQWLTLDDTDGNIDNGTPHYSDIDAGFLQQGFPGYDLDLIGITSVTDLPNTDNETVPYQVVANVQAYVAPSVASADVRYRINGGTWATAAMSPAGGDDWIGSIPPQVSPAVVEYYVQASDSIGNGATNPGNAPISSYSFAVGVITELFADDFESDTGWTVGAAGDSATTGVWLRGAPIGTDAQTNQDHTQVGQNCFFTGQGSAGGSLGENDVDGGYTTVTSPALDLSGHPIATVSYWRWYSNNSGASPSADIFEVELSGNNGSSWTSAEVVGPTGDGTSGGWIQQELAIHEFVTPGAQTRIRFRASDLNSGSIVEAAVDDLVVTGIGATDGCATPVNYGNGKISSLGIAPIIGAAGTPSATTNDLSINVDLGIANQPSILFHGLNSANAPFANGTRLVAFPLVRAGVRVLDFFGSANWDFDVNLADVGTTRYFQVWMRDPQNTDGTGVGMSDGLEVTFCD
jgi:Zn-dependent metalloprotease